MQKVQSRKVRSHFLLTFMVAAFVSGGLFAPLDAKVADPAAENAKRLERGEVILGTRTEGETRFVSARILINESPDKVWTVMTNPYEFQGTISPRMRTVEMLVDKVDESVMKVSVDTPMFLPKMDYVVESHYGAERIDFKRVAGTLKEFKGTWITHPVGSGDKTEIVYSMYIDSGFPVPQWVVRETMKSELAHMLELMRQRIYDVYQKKSRPLVAKSIMAASSHRALTARAQAI